MSGVLWSSGRLVVPSPTPGTTFVSGSAFAVRITDSTPLSRVSGCHQRACSLSMVAALL